MVTVADIAEFFNRFAPPSFAEDYDNVGLLLGHKAKEVRKILLTLDVDETVAKEAKEKGAEMIVSHHPLIFKPLRRLTYEDSVSKTAISLIRDDIALYSSHTNFDSVKAGLGDLFLDKIAKTKHRMPIEGDGENGIGRLATLENEMLLFELLHSLKKTFSLDTIRYVGDGEKKIQKIAVCNGSGADLVYLAKGMGADCYITGDIKYHHARFCHENNLMLVEIPHYQAEKIFCEYAAKLLKEKFENEVEIMVSDRNIDIWKQL